MTKRTKYMPGKLVKGERGQAFILVLILLLLGGLIIGPLLAYMGTGIKAGQVFENKADELYAADAGIEDAIWQIKYDDPATGESYLATTCPTYDRYDYSSDFTYSLSPQQVNGKDVTISIRNIWIPKDLVTPDQTQAKTTIETGKLLVTGSISAASTCQIKIDYDKGGSTDNLTIIRLGVWLPTGFTYVAGSSNLEADNTASYYAVPATSLHNGGQAVIWTFQSNTRFAGLDQNDDGDYIDPLDKDPFPGVNPLDTLMTGKITFQFNGPEGKSPDAVSWVDTNLNLGGGITYTWDADTKVFWISSVAGSQHVESYIAKSEIRKLGSTVTGDYVAVGNSLMTGDPDYRNKLLMQSSATIQNSNSSGAGYIPLDATVEKAYLYWSGWIDHYYWYRSGGNWRWSANPDNWGVFQENGTGLVYDASNLTQMVEGWADGSGKGARVNIVKFNGTNITTHQWQVWPKTNDSPACWYYTCFYDATNLKLSDDVSVKQHIEDEIKTGGSGTYTFTLGHASTVVSPPTSNLRPGYDGIQTPQNPTRKTYMFNLCDNNGNPIPGCYTGYPLGTPAHPLPGQSTYQFRRYNASYAGWSLVIIYSTPDTKMHQLYLYDITNPNFKFTESFPGGASQSNPDFDGDLNPGGKISGFLVPQPIVGEDNAARITCFIGEGDEDKTGDSFKVTGSSGSGANLPDGTGAALNNVWNSKSVGLTVSGVDIDTFYVTWISEILEPKDTWAQVDLPTVGDGFTLSYIILSFRSETTTGGALSYLIR